MRKEEIKLFHFIDIMTVDVENPRIYTNFPGTNYRS